MPKTKNDPVEFKTVRLLMEEIIELIDRFENGETASKNKAEKLLAEYRKKLSTLSKMVTGARLHSLNVAALLVPKKEIENVVELPTNEKVELPE